MVPAHAEKRIDEVDHMSFNSSDMEAYRQENPIPILKQAYKEYQRNKRKATMRRYQEEMFSSVHGNDQDRNSLSATMRKEKSEVHRSADKNFNRLSPNKFSAEKVNEANLVLREEDEGTYGNPNKRLIYAHELGDSMIEEEQDIEADARETDRVFAAYQGKVLDIYENDKKDDDDPSDTKKDDEIG